MDSIQKIAGGICAAKGFRAAGVHCGIRKNQQKKDLALVVSDVPCAAAAVYTQNKVYGAPITVTRENIHNGIAQAIICNSGNANTCNADGVEKAELTCALTARALGLTPSDIVIASTGVIGQPIVMEPIASGIMRLVPLLSQDGGTDAAEAIMTTDTVAKQVAYTAVIGEKTVTVGAIAKGSGMIHPNMATMLSFVTSDVSITPKLLQKALSTVVTDTFNMVSVDGDTSTNDMVAVLANGMAKNSKITEENEDYAIFSAMLFCALRDISRLIAGDGEGATKLLTCTVSGASQKQLARDIAKSVVCSSLVKAAMFGADANWGRILCAIGYTQGDFQVDKIDVSITSQAGSIDVCKNGAGVPFSEETAKAVLLEKEIQLLINMNQGAFGATAWGCDLTYDYVKINGDYRT